MSIGAQISKEIHAEDEAIDVNRLLAEIEDAQNRVNIAILDACRSNPYERRFRSGGQGLAVINAPRGTIISCVTAPGRVAEDGEGRNSPFTGELLNQLQVGNLRIEDLFKRVQVAVRQLFYEATP